MGQISDNARLLSKAHTTKVALVISVAIGYWLQLSPEEQQKLIAAYPWLQHLAPLAAFAAFVIARVWPQGLQAPAPQPLAFAEPASPPPPPPAATTRRPLTPEETRTVLEAARILNERNLT